MNRSAWVPNQKRPSLVGGSATSPCSLVIIECLSSLPSRGCAKSRRRRDGRCIRSYTQPVFHVAQVDVTARQWLSKRRSHARTRAAKHLLRHGQETVLATPQPHHGRSAAGFLGFITRCAFWEQKKRCGPPPGPISTIDQKNDSAFDHVSCRKDVVWRSPRLAKIISGILYGSRVRTANWALYQSPLL